MKNRYYIITACLLVVLSGCSSLPERRSSDSGRILHAEKPLEVAADLRFEDVPIPVGFNTLRDQSFIFQDASIRVGLLRYSGHANASQVIAFFKSQMALYNWDLQNIVEHEVTTLNFIKADESCVITVEPLTTKILLSIMISPKKGSISTGFGSRKEKF